MDQLFPLGVGQRVPDDAVDMPHRRGGRPPSVFSASRRKKRLNLADGELAVVRRRVRYLNGEPFNTNDSYFPLSLVQNTEIVRPEDIARGANQVLAEAGYRQTRALDVCYVRMPTLTKWGA